MNRRAALMTLAGSASLLRGSDSGKVPVLVELFTSEGCSSCPPADALLASLDRQPVSGVEIIGLAEHVDYWNHLGWADPFSSPLFSARQRQYALKFRMESVYTPQMVINGRVESPGSDSSKVRAAIEEAAHGPRASMRIETVDSGAAHDTPDGTRLRVTVDAIPSSFKPETFDVILAMTESGVQSNVAAGENAGKSLRHAGLVRSMTRIAQINTRKERGYTATLGTQGRDVEPFASARHRIPAKPRERGDCGRGILFPVRLME